MTNGVIWWDDDDEATPDRIGNLGGEDVVAQAVAAVLPGRTVKLRALTPGISGSVVFLASPETVHDMRRVPEVDGVLKVGPARMLADEVDRYDKWVAHVLTHASHFAPLDAPHDLSETARVRPDAMQALHYRHVGHTTFGDRVRELVSAEDTAGLGRLLDALLVILRPWQEMSNPITSRSLTSDGIYSFRSTPFADFRATCERLNASCAEDDGDLIDIDLAGRVGDFWERDVLGSERQLQAILHGDLHIDNILVDTNNSPTLIDFGATGEGHFLRDLSTLEAHLVLRGLAPPGQRVHDQHRRFLTDLQMLYAPRAFLEPNAQLGVSPLFAVVSRLRRYALYCLMRGDSSYLPQYAIGVLRHAIRMCVRQDDVYSDTQRWISAHVATALRRALTVDNRRLAIRTADVGTAANSLAFLNDPRPESADTSGVNAPRTECCSADQWHALAEALRRARRVDFLGIVPMPLVSALLTSWGDAESRAMPLPQLRYITLPRPPRIDGLPLPNWRVALMGMRNLATIVLRTQVAVDRFVEVTESVTANCIIRAVAAGGESTVYFTGHIGGSTLLENASVLSVLPDSDGRVSDLLDTSLRLAEPFVIRQVDCLPLRGPARPAEPDLLFQASRLSPYGDPGRRTACLLPIALTILRTRGPGGRQVLVKMRSPLADNDDFGKLSFLSAQILANDVAEAHGRVVHAADDAEDAFVDLWESIGSPDPFVISDAEFIQTAKRDVYETTLLELRAERFTRRGFLVLNREDTDVQLGFAILTVDLKPAEVAAARRAGQAIKDAAGPLLRVMRVDDLLSGRHPVNRIMREHRDWLLARCLGPDVS